MAVAVTPRSVGLMLAATLAAGWFETSITPGQTPQQRPTNASRRAERRSTEIVIPQTDRLREHLAEPALPEPGRNPFVYGNRPTARPGAGNSREDVAPVAVPEPLPVMLPVIKLSGIASNMENGVVVLTAIVNDNGLLEFVKAGDKLSNGSSVVRVEETSITIIDASGVTQTIRLP